MPAHVLRGLVAAAAVFAALPSWAQQGPAGACEMPAAEADPLSDRAGMLAEYQRLPQHCLQALVTTCSEAANRTFLDFGSAAVCSFAYEALLTQGFGGDLRALLAWWSSQRNASLQ
jgi:hypothetical protein